MNEYQLYAILRALQYLIRRDKGVGGIEECEEVIELIDSQVSYMDRGFAIDKQIREEQDAARDRRAEG